MTFTKFHRKLIGNIAVIVLHTERYQEIRAYDGLGAECASMVTIHDQPESNTVERLQVLDFVEKIIHDSQHTDLPADHAFLAQPLICVAGEDGAQNVLIPVRTTGPGGSALWVDYEGWCDPFSASTEDGTDLVVETFNNILVNESGNPDVAVKEIK